MKLFKCQHKSHHVKNWFHFRLVGPTSWGDLLVGALWIRLPGPSTGSLNPPRCALFISCKARCSSDALGGYKQNMKTLSPMAVTKGCSKKLLLQRILPCPLSQTQKFLSLITAKWVPKRCIGCQFSGMFRVLLEKVASSLHGFAWKLFFVSYFSPQVSHVC